MGKTTTGNGRAIGCGKALDLVIAAQRKGRETYEVITATGHISRFTNVRAALAWMSRSSVACTLTGGVW